MKNAAAAEGAAAEGAADETAINHLGTQKENRRKTKAAVFFMLFGITTGDSTTEDTVKTR